MNFLFHARQGRLSEYIRSFDSSDVLIYWKNMIRGILIFLPDNFLRLGREYRWNLSYLKLKTRFLL